MLCDLSKELGFITESALNYARSAKNHHHAMTMVNVLQQGGWSELILPYVRQRMAEGQEVSVNDFLYQWMVEVKDPNSLYMFDQLWTYIGSIQVYHMGMRRNNHHYVNAGLTIFAPMFSAHPNTSKYQLIEIEFADTAVNSDSRGMFAGLASSQCKLFTTTNENANNCC